MQKGNQMKVSALVEKTGLKSLNEYKDKEIEGVYISDMVSDIITGAQANGLLVTLQTHKSLIAAANLVDVAATLAHVLGIEPPAQCEGRLVREAFEEQKAMG